MALEGARQLLQRAREAGEQAYPDADYDLALAYYVLARALQMAGGAEEALPLLDESRRRFESIEQTRHGSGAARMASVCIAEQGDCLLALGRLDEAAAAYEEAIRRSAESGGVRSVAVSKGQLGSVRLDQGRYADALTAFAEARERFTELGEPSMVAVSWHQTGMVCRLAGQPEAAEDAYRKSLAIKVRLGNAEGLANTVTELGVLYWQGFNRPEEAVALFRQAVDKYVQTPDVATEGRTRSNLAGALRAVRRLDEARVEIRRAIACKAQFGRAAEPWMSWSILANIETDADDAIAASAARRNAIASYLAYRRDGGENHFPDGRIALAVTEFMLAGNMSEAASLLHQLAADSNATRTLGAFMRALQAIVAGSRDRVLADAPELDYRMVAEILVLIDTLDAHA